MPRNSSSAAAAPRLVMMPRAARASIAAQVVDLAYVVDGQVSDEGAASRLLPHQALRAKLPESLSDWPAADLQLPGDSSLDQPLT